jgi:hypothetical protein
MNERITLRDVRVTYDGKVIGAIESLTFKVERDNEAAHEGGTHETVEIVDGAEKITGTAVRAFVELDTLKEMFPNSAKWPSFTLFSTIVSAKSPARDCTLFGVKFDSFDVTELSATGGGWAKNNLPFKAIGYKLG